MVLYAASCAPKCNNPLQAVSAPIKEEIGSVSEEDATRKANVEFVMPWSTMTGPHRLKQDNFVGFGCVVEDSMFPLMMNMFS